MPTLREATTAVIIRSEWIGDGFTTEPYETSWAGEAVVFLLAHDDGAKGALQVQISPDGMNWTNEGTEIAVPANGQVTFGKLENFGGWLRLEAHLPAGGQSRLTATLQLKG